jgi:type I restriction enzyme M protein
LQSRSPYRDRHGETLFIDARKLGFMKDRVLRDFSAEDIGKIAGTFRAWRHDSSIKNPKSKIQHYSDIPGFCKSATLQEIATHSYVLTPGRYVGAEDIEDDGEPFDEKMARLTGELSGQFAESTKLDQAIAANLKALGYEL